MRAEPHARAAAGRSPSRAPSFPRIAALLSVLLLAAVPAAALEVPYQVEITGLEDAALLDAVKTNSGLVADAGRPPPTTAALRRRVEDDLPRIAQVLDSFGYYGAVVDYEIDDRESPARVVLKIAPGERYRVTGYNVTGPSPALSDGSVRVGTVDLGIERDAPAEAAAIVQSEARLLASFARQSYPLARIVDENIVVDHAAKSVVVNLSVDLGPRARFGDVTLEGLETVRPEFVYARLPWRHGADYDADQVDAAREALRESGLFAAIAIDLGTQVDAEGLLPVTVRVTEAKHRSIGAGVGWSTSDGFGGKAFWEHRNLMHGGERFNVAALGGERVNGLDAALRAPGLPDPRLTYLAAGGFRDENRDAYDSLTAGGSLGVEYAYSPTLTFTAGGSLEYEDITDNTDRREFTLVGLPLSLIRDTSDDLFDPTRGNRLTASATPYVSLIGDNTQFFVMRLADAQYLSLTSDDWLILAGWARIGSILGDQSADIPATKRLYGGGGGSVRAFGYQTLGPLDGDGDPLGGRSQVEAGLELRGRITDEIGGVVFVEGGNVYGDPWPDFGKAILWGAGVGLRYYTDLGPIRLDLAFPVNPRDPDDAFQLYVSLGQAF